MVFVCVTFEYFLFLQLRLADIVDIRDTDVLLDECNTYIMMLRVCV